MPDKDGHPEACRSSRASTAYDEAVAKLARSKLRTTGPRRAILAVLSAEHGPFRAEEIHTRMGRDTCDLVTIYRSLAALEDARIVRRCDFGDGSLRYELAAGDHHHHIICRHCRSVRTLDHACVAGTLEEVARSAGYADVTHSLEIFGICPACRKKLDAAKGHRGHGPGQAVQRGAHC